MMKRFPYLLAILFYLPWRLHGQEVVDTTVSKRPVYELFDLEKQPQFPGGEQALLKYLSENTTLPAIAKTDSCATQSTFVFSFIIEADGRIAHVKAERPICNKQIEQHYQLLLKNMPKWSPGKKGGKAVATQYILPIRIHLK